MLRCVGAKRPGPGYGLRVICGACEAGRAKPAFRLQGEETHTHRERGREREGKMHAGQGSGKLLIPTDDLFLSWDGVRPCMRLWESRQPSMDDHTKMLGTSIIKVSARLLATPLGVMMAQGFFSDTTTEYYSYEYESWCEHDDTWGTVPGCLG